MALKGGEEVLNPIFSAHLVQVLVSKPNPIPSSKTGALNASPTDPIPIFPGQKSG